MNMQTKTTKWSRVEDALLATVLLLLASMLLVPPLRAQTKTCPPEPVVDATWHLMEAEWEARLEQCLREEIGQQKQALLDLLARQDLVVMQESFANLASVGSLEEDSLALVALYNSTDGPGWANNSNWLTGEVSTWHGVTVAGGRVVGLDLVYNQLSGSIPAELGNLSSLQWLDLYANLLSGEIPEALGNLSSLQMLGLADNNLSGEIPPELGNLSNLQWLYLYYNKFSGAVPAALGNLSGLIWLFLQDNQLSGTMPTTLGSLSSLQVLDIGYNQLSGEIPAELGYLSDLQALVLISNNLAGAIPSAVGDLSSLQSLNLGINQLSGEIPPELGSLTSLVYLGLHTNQLSGEIPATLGNLSSLRDLDLYDNRFSGAIPVELGNLSNLEWLSFHGNQIEDLPNLSDLRPMLQGLAVYDNHLTFEDIEPSIGLFRYFRYAPQGDVGTPQTLDVHLGGSLSLQIPVGGVYNQYQWSKDGGPIPGATSDTYTINAATAADAGTYVLRITNTVATDLTLESHPITVAVVAGNTPPVITALSVEPTAGNEGDALSFSATATDDDGDPLTFSWDFADGSAAGTGSTLTHVYADDGIYPVVLTVSDGQGGAASQTVEVAVNNVAPSVGPIAAPADPVQIITAVVASADFSDPGTNDTHTASWDWGDGQSASGTVSEANGSGTVTGSHAYAAPGTYTVTLTVTDDDGGQGQALYEFVVVFDPSAGFVSGGGWIDSPPGACRLSEACEDATGKAHFDFVFRYRKDAAVPDGNTQFRFKSGGLDFQSRTYDWLIVSGAESTFKGSGTLNGPGDYGFMISATDGQIGGGQDRFRIRIWQMNTEQTVVYDSQFGDASNADPTTPLGGGNIVIHLADKMLARASDKQVTEELAPAEEVPETFELRPNYPNPFNPQTQIRFALPEPTHVRLVVYDMLGREVVCLADGVMEAGYHEVTWHPTDLPSGVYVLSMDAGRFSQTRTMVLMK